MKRKADDQEEEEEAKLRVLIVGTHEDGESFLVVGTLAQKELNVLREFANSSIHERQEVVTDYPESLAACVLKQIYKYVREEDDDELSFYEHNSEQGEGDFVSVDATDAWEQPCHTIVWSLLA